MAYKRKVEIALELMCNAKNIPIEWFHIGGSYGYTQIQMYYYDDISNELTTGITGLYTGTSGECTRCLLSASGEYVKLPGDGAYFENTLDYQITRQRDRMAAYEKRKAIQAIIDEKTF